MKNADGIRIHRWRLTDSLAYELAQRSYPISMPMKASIQLWRPGKNFPSLGQILAGLEAAYGPSSNKYDNYKQSFYFPFLLQADIDDHSIHWLWNLWDYKGAIDFQFRRIIEREEDLSKKSDVLQSYSEIPEADFEYIIGFQIGWLEGYVNAIWEYFQPTAPFFKCVPASLTIYGYCDNQFFCDDYEDHQEYESRIAELKRLIPPEPSGSPELQHRLTEARKWIESAKRESVKMNVSKNLRLK